MYHLAFSSVHLSKVVLINPHQNRDIFKLKQAINHELQTRHQMIPIPEMEILKLPF